VSDLWVRGWQRKQKHCIPHSNKNTTFLVPVSVPRTEMEMHQPIKRTRTAIPFFAVKCRTVRSITSATKSSVFNWKTKETNSPSGHRVTEPSSIPYRIHSESRERETERRGGHTHTQWRRCRVPGGDHLCFIYNLQSNSPSFPSLSPSLPLFLSRSLSLARSLSLSQVGVFVPLAPRSVVL